MKKILSTIFILITFFFSVHSFAADYKTQDTFADKVDSLFAELNNTDSPGIAVLVVHEGNVLLRRGYGMANLEHKIPITPTTVFDIASVSKQFTGMAIAMLIDQGLISGTDDIRRYISQLPDFGHKITIN